MHAHADRNSMLKAVSFKGACHALMYKEMERWLAVMKYSAWILGDFRAVQTTHDGSVNNPNMVPFLQLMKWLLVTRDSSDDVFIAPLAAALRFVAHVVLDNVHTCWPDAEFEKIELIRRTLRA